MYAIVEIQGQQFKAEAGKQLYVHRVPGAEKDQSLTFENVLLVDNDGTVNVGTPRIEGAKVVCNVVEPLVKGDKIIVFKMKRRKDERKRNGHRQQFTLLEIKEIIG